MRQQNSILQVIVAVVLLACTIGFVAFMSNKAATYETKTLEGIPHNYWTPGDATYMDEDVMWISADGDTIWE